MITLIPADQIKPRAEAINLTVAELATRAGVRPHNIYRLAAGEGVALKTHKAISDKLLSLEHKMRVYLLELEEGDAPT